MTVEDKSETSGPPGETDEEMKARKRKERLEQNRISARESRKRKKTMIEELQRTVITLSKENKELNERNETLRRQLMEIGAKVCFGDSRNNLIQQFFLLPRHVVDVIKSRDVESRTNCTGDSVLIASQPLVRPAFVDVGKNEFFFSPSFFLLIVSFLLLHPNRQYPNIVPLQAIVGQATATPPAGEAPTAPGSASTADGVPAAAASSNAAQAPSSFMGSLNPMTWLGGQKPADGSAPAGGGSGTASV